MLKINNYNGRDIQTFLSLLNQLEADGVTDIRFARERIQRKLDQQRLEIKSRVMIDSRGEKALRRAAKICPSCGRTRLESWPNNDGLNIKGCRVCRYSEVVA